MCFFFFFFLMIRRPPRSTLFPHDALPISRVLHGDAAGRPRGSLVHARQRADLSHGAGTDAEARGADGRSEEHTSELQSQFHLVCRLLLEKKKNNKHITPDHIKQKSTQNET